MHILEITPIATPRPRLGKYKVYNKTKYTQYKTDLMWLIKSLKIPQGDYSEFEGVFYFPYPKSTAKKRRVDGQKHRIKPDADNVVKGIVDSLEQAGILNNDSQLHKITASKYYTTDKRGHIEFKLR